MSLVVVGAVGWNSNNDNVYKLIRGLLVFFMLKANNKQFNGAHESAPRANSSLICLARAQLISFLDPPPNQLVRSSNYYRSSLTESTEIAAQLVLDAGCPCKRQ